MGFVNGKDIKEAIFDYIVNCNGIDASEYGDEEFESYDDMLKHTELFQSEQNGIKFFKITTTKGTYNSDNLD